MSESVKPICVNRILVSLDSSRHSIAALHAAIELAHHYNASLKGIFVEDLTLLSLAEMPFRQEVGEYSAIIREISSDGMTHGIFVQSRRVIRIFRKLINQTDLIGEIAVLRGNVNKTIKQESKECDLLILGKSGTNPLTKNRLGSTTRAMIRDQKKTLLLVEEHNQLGSPIIVLYENSRLGQIALETACDLLDPGETLIILLKEDDPLEFESDRKRIIEWGTEMQINLTIQSFKPRSFERFLQRVHGIKTGLFILPHLQEIREILHKSPIEIILEKISLPVLLIRNADMD